MAEKPAKPCGAKTEVYSRIVGYFRPVQNWNVGKREEFRQRRSFRFPETPSEDTSA
jgi:anaerobic ribonucleoside-triphosphate reductase